MKILVAGGGGYIGSALVPVLIEHGYEVTVIDLLWFGKHLPKNIQLIQKDILECTSKDLKGYDQIIFLAGLSNDPMAEYSPVKNFIYNAALPSFLAYEARKAKVKRFIYGSTCSVYGYTIDQFYDENSSPICSYPYGISKLQGEQGILQLNCPDFSVISLRQGTICGYSPRMRLDLIVNTMFKTAMAEQKIFINNPSIWRPIYDMRDAVTGIIRAIQANQAVNGIFNMTSGNFTVGQVGDYVKNEIEELTGKGISIRINNLPDVRNYKVAIEKAKTLLSFQPEYSIKDTIIDLYEHKDLFDDYDNDNYYNIKVFKKLKLV
ncbi:MAG: NAD(P)-dependent oxidoreductase [Elusimicrobia bacterium]|nr:NAD(P)-dependent oxidoreductase [Candidatus Liberimonas magnetica]